jgi:hypothetical protein
VSLEAEAARYALESARAQGLPPVINDVRAVRLAGALLRSALMPEKAK